MFKPTVAQEITQTFDSEIKKFRDNIEKRYGVKLYIVSPNFNNIYPVELSIVWNKLFEVVEENHPQYMDCYSNPKLTREREWMNYVHAYCLVSAKQLNYGCTEIARFLDKNHASVIHSAKKGAELLEVNDFDFTAKYCSLLTKVKDYVGTIYQDSKV
jgi:hypothetical protein